MIENTHKRRRQFRWQEDGIIDMADQSWTRVAENKEECGKPILVIQKYTGESI